MFMSNPISIQEKIKSHQACNPRLSLAYPVRASAMLGWSSRTNPCRSGVTRPPVSHQVFRPSPHIDRECDSVQGYSVLSTDLDIVLLKDPLDPQVVLHSFHANCLLSRS